MLGLCGAPCHDCTAMQISQTPRSSLCPRAGQPLTAVAHVAVRASRRRRHTGGKKAGVDAYLAPELARCPADCVTYTPAGEGCCFYCFLFSFLSASGSGSMPPPASVQEPALLGQAPRLLRPHGMQRWGPPTDASTLPLAPTLTDPPPPQTQLNNLPTPPPSRPPPPSPPPRPPPPHTSTPQLHKPPPHPTSLQATSGPWAW
jgi:hypothetical protein